MSLSWPDAFLGSITGVGGIVATAVTIIKLKSSNSSVMEITPNDKRELSESISKLLGYYNDLRLSIMELKKDTEHLGEKLDDMVIRAERDHREVKKLTMILYPLIKDEIADARRKIDLPGSETETGEI